MYNRLLKLTHPGFRTRGMPAISFAAAGAVVIGLKPEAARGALATPRLPRELAWAKLTRLPVLGNEIALERRGLTESTISNENDPPLRSKACFPANPRTVQVRF